MTLQDVFDAEMICRDAWTRIKRIEGGEMLARVIARLHMRFHNLMPFPEFTQ